MNTIKMVPVEEEFKRNPELKKEDLQHLKDWYSKQPHLPQHITDNELIIFLHSNYYRLEPTKTTIENYYTCRTHVPEFFSARDPLSEQMQLANDTLFVMGLDQTTPEGYNVMYARMMNLDLDRFIYNDGMRFYNMIKDLWILQSGTQKGQILICDIAGVTMAHLLRIPPMGVKKYIFYLQEAVPFRIKSLHFLNTSSIMDYVLKLIKPFLKKELMDILYLHPNLDSLAKHIPIEMLPNETGGKGGPMREMFAPVVKNLEAHREYLIAEEKTMRVNEALRPGKAKSANEVFGIEGSFKKLDID